MVLDDDSKLVAHQDPLLPQHLGNMSYALGQLQGILKLGRFFCDKKKTKKLPFSQEVENEALEDEFSPQGCHFPPPWLWDKSKSSMFFVGDSQAQNQIRHDVTFQLDVF